MTLFSKDVLRGIMLGKAKCEIRIERSAASDLGYRVILRVKIRAEMLFLEAIERSLAQHEISCILKRVEHKARKKPILVIGGKDNLEKLCSLVPNLPDAKGEWEDFRTVVEMIVKGEHLTLDGLDKILKIKGLIC
jgi:hypothetical protein